MNRLDIGNELFMQLASNPPVWWNNLVKDKDVYIDIRKDNYIDVYYNGGNIIRELRYKRNSFLGSINYKYLLSDKSEYINYDLSSSTVQLTQKKIDLLAFSKFSQTEIKRIKVNISKYYPSNSEKGIQAKFVTKTDCFLDTEFAYNYNNIKLRIDLVWIDIVNKKILFIELKTMGDSRLYTDEIYLQLKKYNDFAIEYEKPIKVYFQEVFDIKKRLNILPKGLKSISSLDGFTLEKKPLLLFGDCEQNWIDNNAKGINAKIDKVAVGSYYFGNAKYNCDLIPKTNRNRYIF